MTLIINPDLKERKKIGKKILENKGFCPCMIVSNSDTKCPCKDKREKSICICNLYIEEGK